MLKTDLPMRDKLGEHFQMRACGKQSVRVASGC